MIEKSEIQEYLSVIYDLKTKYKFYDVHVHPFDIISPTCNYKSGSNHSKISALRNAKNSAPTIEALDLDSKNFSKTIQDPKNKLTSIIASRRLYSHVGPTVFEHQMNLGGIDKALLLPVAPPQGPVDEQMKKILEIFGRNNRFLFAGSVPNTIETKNISHFIEEQVNQFDIRAIKIHPNITNINFISPAGKEKVERILETCGHFRLPIIVHGGRSPILNDIKASENGCIKNFENINWGLSTEPVIIAHGGLFGCDLQEIEHEALPVLQKLLSKHSNVMIGISGIDFAPLFAILKQIDPSRILFGSDALYYKQWAMILKLTHALKKLKADLITALPQIVSINPSNTIFKNNVKKNDETSRNAMQPSI
jgi:predicted TIM-barrel fold metal-dependent hydrolase